jgi:hypothetical protein
MKMTFFWDMAIIAVMRKSVHTAEKPIYVYETTRHHFPEGCPFHTPRRKNLKSHPV